MSPYVKLGILSLLPLVLTLILYFLDKKTPLGRLNIGVKQAICGILFGGLAILGTEYGIPINGAQINCRDGAVLTAGLMFGGPAGVLAGLIGGIERWISVAWGVGTFTRLACTVSTILAGLYSAFLRRFLFENKKPGWLLSFAIGVVMEIIHLTMVFITNMRTPIEAMAVVKACTVPMVLCNAFGVMLPALGVTLLSGDRSPLFARQERVRISQTIQRWLLVTVLLAFFATSYFVFSLQDKIAVSQTDDRLEQAIESIAADIHDASDQNLLRVAHEVAGEVEQTDDLFAAAERYHVEEVSRIDANGIIVASTVAKYFGFDMNAGPQSREFLCLLEDQTEFVQSYGPITSDPSIMRKYAGVRVDDGFIQVGYDAEHFQRDIGEQVAGITKNRTVGNTGFVLILDQTLEVVSCPKSFEAATLDLSGIRLYSPDVTFTAPYGDETYFCRYQTVEGYYICSFLPSSEANQMRNIALYVNTFMEILVFAILFALVYLLIKRVVVNQIKNINGSLARITGGDLNEVVNVRSNQEFASLSDDINTTVDTLKRYIAEASARIDRELEFAKDIQSSALPSTFPAFPHRREFDIFALMDPAREVGGDFYDFYLTHEDTLHFLVADVSGKGIPAAMFMMRAKTELKTLTEAGQPLNDVFTNGNNALCEGNDAGMFVTAWQGSLDLVTGLVRFANAGHNPPLVRHRDGLFEFLRSPAGFVLAGMEGVRYRTQELQLAPGDTLYLYTDGVTEAQNAAGELYGEERLLRAANETEYESAQALCDHIRADVDRFVNGAAQFDDITMVAVTYFGRKPHPTIRFDEASIGDVEAIQNFVDRQLETVDCRPKTAIQLHVAIDEVYSNIVKYGYPDKKGPVTVELIEEEEPHRIVLRFYDEGIPYNPLVKEDPDVTLSAEERSIGGLGIFVVKKTMDDVRYEYTNDQNILTIYKNL